MQPALCRLNLGARVMGHEPTDQVVSTLNITQVSGPINWVKSSGDQARAVADIV